MSKGTNTQNALVEEDEPVIKRQSLISEFSAYLMENKKWWMIPIIIMVLLFGALFFLVAANPAAAPFIYSLF